MRFIPWLVLAAALASCASAPDAGPGTIRVEGDVAHPTSWTADRIADRFQDVVRTVEHRTKGGVIRLRAVPLAALVSEAGPTLDESRKNHALAFVVVVSARDGYTAAFTYDEVVPRPGAEPWVRLAFAEEQGPLPPRFGPARIVLTSDEGGARRMYGVDRIRVVDLTDRE